MRKKDGGPGRLAELLVAHFERVLAPDVEVKSPDHIPGRTSGELREVDVALRRRVGTADVLIVIECRDRKAPADVRWIDELVSKRDEVGASVIVAVSTSGFSKGARRSAEAKGVLLRELTQFGADEIDQWFVSSQLSLPTAHFVGAHVLTGDPRWPGQLIEPQTRPTAPRFAIPPNPGLLTLDLLCNRLLEQILSAPEAVARIPPDGSGQRLGITFTPEREGAEVVSNQGTYPLEKIVVEFELRMEHLTPSEMHARNYEDSHGVFAQKTHYVYPIPGGYWRVEVTAMPEEGERYLFTHPDVPASSPTSGRQKRKRSR